MPGSAMQLFQAFRPVVAGDREFGPVLSNCKQNLVEQSLATGPPLSV